METLPHHWGPILLPPASPPGFPPYSKCGSSGGLRPEKWPLRHFYSLRTDSQGLQIPRPEEPDGGRLRMVWVSGANEVLLVPLPRRKTPPSGHPLGCPKHPRQQKKPRNAYSTEARWDSDSSGPIWRGAENQRWKHPHSTRGAAGLPLIPGLPPEGRGRGHSNVPLAMWLWRAWGSLRTAGPQQSPCPFPGHAAAVPGGAVLNSGRHGPPPFWRIT